MKSLEGKKLGVYAREIRYKAMHIHGHFDLSVHLKIKNRPSGAGFFIHLLFLFVLGIHMVILIS
jgi:hypothetical protein